MSDERRTTEPHDRLTLLCGAMTEALDAHPERGDERCIVFLHDDDRGGMVLHGYEDESEAILDLLVLHLKALFAINGQSIHFVPLNGGVLS